MTNIETWKHLRSKHVEIQERAQTVSIMNALCISAVLLASKYILKQLQGDF